jgi:hypothetical protein
MRMQHEASRKRQAVEIHIEAEVQELALGETWVRF